MALQDIRIEYKTSSGDWRPAGRSGQMTDIMISNYLKSAIKTYGNHGGAVRAVTYSGQLVDMLTK